MVLIEALNEKGYGVATEDGKNLYISDALPGEKVGYEIKKKKKGVIYAQSTRITDHSPHRIKPKDDAFLSTSPWQNMRYEQQIVEKKVLVESYFQELAQFSLPEFEILPAKKTFNYRNKVEYGFYIDDDGFSLSFFKRDSKNAKVLVTETSLVSKNMNSATSKIVSAIKESGIPHSKLKSLVIREAVISSTIFASLFLKSNELNFNPKPFESLVTNGLFGGIQINYSDPRSPASLVTETLAQFGEQKIREDVRGKVFEYDLNGFFQVNVEMFEAVLKSMEEYIVDAHEDKKLLLDLYAGVGTIGISLAHLFNKVIAVELYEGSKVDALANAGANGIDSYQFIEGKSEDLIISDPENRSDWVIVDPPRSGLHPKLIKSILASKPKHLIYMSCNPKTQARDFNLLKNDYSIKKYEAFDFYPNTPHLESVAYLERSN